MRALIQVVRQASARRLSDEASVSIDRGLCVYIGVHSADSAATAGRMADKILGLRLLDDAGAMWSTSVLEASAEILLVSNFTLYGDVSKGRRPSWSHAADPDSARTLFETVAQHLVAKGAKLSTAFFGEEMEISAVNYGPTNLLVEF